MATVYSYVRFSSKKQEQGDSVRRQIKAGDDWLARNPEHTLDTSVRLQDLGVSAYRGANLDEKGALGAFIALAKKPDSPVAKGSILLIERLDRFSRQQTRKAYRAFVDLVEAGITVQTLDPPQTINEDNIDDLPVVLGIILLMTIAHEQSKEKSRRVGSVWEAKRAAAREGITMFRRCPAWLEWSDEQNKFIAKPHAVGAIEYAFNRTADGCGQKQLVNELNKKFEPLGKSGKWNSSYVQKLLDDRSVLGELQPHRFDSTGERVPIGEPLIDYYPRIISDELFYAAAAGKASRKKAKGPSANFVNLFVGILFGTDGHSLHIQTSRAKRRSKETYIQRRLFSYGYLRGLDGACPHSVNYWAIEASVLRMLYELDETSVVATPSKEGQVFAAEQKIAAINRRIEALRAALIDTNPGARSPKEITEALVALESQLQDADKRLSEARSAAQQDPGKAGQQARDLVAALQATPPDAHHALRLRLRSVVSKLVKKITVDAQKVGRRTRPVIVVEMQSGEKRQLFDGRNSVVDPKLVENQGRYTLMASSGHREAIVSVRFLDSKKIVEQSDRESMLATFGIAPTALIQAVNSDSGEDTKSPRKPR